MRGASGPARWPGGGRGSGPRSTKSIGAEAAPAPAVAVHVYPPASSFSLHDHLRSLPTVVAQVCWPRLPSSAVTTTSVEVGASVCPEKVTLDPETNEPCEGDGAVSATD